MAFEYAVLDEFGMTEIKRIFSFGDYCASKSVHQRKYQPHLVKSSCFSTHLLVGLTRCQKELPATRAYGTRDWQLFLTPREAQRK